jgi:ferredoxin, 2Fe-2S
MAKVTWKLADGSEMFADAPKGRSLMQAATAIGVPNIVGECGGCQSCGTCHVYVDESWIMRTGTADGSEEDILDMASAPRQSNSRLSCQIAMKPDLDGIVVHVPA